MVSTQFPGTGKPELVVPDVDPSIEGFSQGCANKGARVHACRGPSLPHGEGLVRNSMIRSADGGVGSDR